MPSDKKAGSLLDRDLVEAGLLAILIATRDDASATRQGKAAPAGRPTEIVLADVGFSISDIARVTGKPYETVKMRLRRARARAAKNVDLALEGNNDGTKG